MPKEKQQYTSTYLNREALQNSVKCGCVCCKISFDFEDITSWKDDEQTALCPECNGDEVMGFDSHFIIMNNNLQAQYRKHLMRKISNNE